MEICQLLAVFVKITTVIQDKEESATEGETMTIIKADFGQQASTDKKNQETEKPAPSYQLHVSLAFSEPLIWRRLLVPGEITLEQLHQVLQICMGWSDEHNHQFYVGKVFYHNSPTGEQRFNESNVDLHSLEEAMRWCFSYIYDAGDGWEHNIELEEILPPNSAESYPQVLDGEWAVPPESVSGVFEYGEVLHALENRNSKTDRMLKNEGLTNFDPYKFDQETLNAALQNDVGKIKRVMR